LINLRNIFAYSINDSEQVRVEKVSIFLVASICTLAGIIWTGLYYVVFGLIFTTFLPAIFTLIVGSSLVISHKTKNHHYTIYPQIISIMYVTALIQWSIGDVFASGFVLAWAILGPICALMFYNTKQSVFWFLLYLINLVITLVFNDYFKAHGIGVEDETRKLFFFMNLSFSGLAVFGFTSFYVSSAINERARVQTLLDANLEQEILLRQSDKLATLGKLSAGVAHELNNPAAAVQRGIWQLRNEVLALEKTQYELGIMQPTPIQMESIASCEVIIKERSKEPLELDSLLRSDQENEIQTWLEEKGIDKAWELAPALVNISYNCPRLDELTAIFSSEQLPKVVTLLCSKYNSYNLLEEIGHGAVRITEIVKSLKSYSYLDQGPLQSVDIHEGIDNTLVMLRSKLKNGIMIKRNYASNAPRIEAYGSELNQVWTNIIDNATAAMNGKGTIEIETQFNENRVLVVIKDNGPGISKEIQNQLFNPFFTTKAPGEGTGLGLSISYNIIVKKHQGKMSVQSKNNETCFIIEIPLYLKNADALKNPTDNG